MRAIVIGASVAGLLAARALSDFAESVALIDRDAPPDSPTPRKGVPQGRHVHGVLAGGFDALRSFFPGIDGDLVADGAWLADIARDVLWFNNGSWRMRCKIGVVGCIQTRPLLELHIRRRVSKLPNVRPMLGCSVDGLAFDAGKSRVTGVRVTESGQQKILNADFVIDCSGRGSRTPAWLAEAGIGKPPETVVTVNVGYSTRFFRISSEKNLPWRAVLILNRPPHCTRLGASFFVESGELLVTLGGLFRDYPPDDDAGFLKFAESLEHPELFQAIQDAEPASPIATYRFPAHVWHHYDRLKNLPPNLLVLGDALCSFNPIYGQGMTVAALEAQALHRCFASSALRANANLLRDRYFRDAVGIVKSAWTMATGADLAYSQAEGARPFGQGMVLRYLNHITGLACYDKKALTIWNEVTNMQRPLSALFAPSMAARVMRRSIAGGPAPNSALPSILS